MDYGFKRAGMTFSLMLICILSLSNAFSQTCTGDPNSMVLDDDFDGYKNGDETLNGTDKCSSISVPLDFDEDYTSDMLDADDDNDGLSDIADKFALDKQNGTATNIPVYYRFQNPNNGGIGNSGFTGLMNTGATNYTNLYSVADIVIGGASSKFIVNNISTGDALGATNTQKNGFQFGVNAGAFPFNYTISSRLMAPFTAIIPADFQSMGMFMGTGDQDNYLKISCASNGGVGGIEVVKEVAGVVTSNMYSASILSASQVNFYFTVNRAANTVQPSYSKNGGATVNIGSAISVPSSWLSNVLAVGIISTSRGATAFSASWDNIAVQPISSNGQWQTINTTNTCVARHDCGFVQNGSKFFLLGGHETNSNYTEVYNYSSKTWSVGADIRDATPPIPLHHFQAVQIRGMIYLGCAFTGVTPNDIPADNVYFYDPPYNLWHTGIVIPQERRRGASAAVTYNEKIYFIGGLKGGHNSGWTNYLDVYDPYTSTWTILPDAPHERDHFQAVVHNGKIYCIGGRKTGFGGSTYAETVEQTDVYDIEEQTWSTLPSPECDIMTPRGGASVGLIGDDIFVIGGENMSQTAALNTTEAYNVKTKSWRTVAGMNTGRQGTQAIVSNYGIYIVGGTSSRGESPDLSSVEVFYPYGTTAATGTAFTKGISAQIPSDNISFGQVPIGTTSTKSVWLKNTGGTQAMVITKIQIAANSTNFYSVTYPYTPPYTVNPGDSTKIQVTFRPNSAGVISGTLYTSNTATDADNTSWDLTGTGITQQTAVRINCSGPQFTTASSNVFSEDFYNLPGTTGLSTSQPISGTSDDRMYQTARSGSAFSYNIPVQNNTYTVNLYFAEIASNAVAGINVFDVKIENSTKITALDLFTTAGLYTAYTRTFTIPVTDQMMNLDFIATAGNAKISAIELIPAAVIQGILTAVPMPVEFPVTDLNAGSSPITVTLTNTGTASLNITSVNITGTNAANFVQTYGINPTTLPPGSTKTFTVTFLPNSSGLKTATLNVVNTGMNATLSIPLKGTGSSTSEPCGYFVEQNGLLVMEVESQKPTEYWTPNTAFPNYTGTEYYTWQGANNLFEKGHGLMSYEFKITTPGKYRFRLRSRHPGPDPTHFNDIWVRFPDHGCTFEKNGQLMEEPGTGWWIMSMATADAWTYNSFGRRRTYWEIYVEFKDPGIYNIDLAGRVEYFTIDRMVLYKMDQYTEWQACGSNPPQSPWEDCPQTPYTWYRDKDLDDYGDPNVTVQSFTKPGAGWIWNNQDCNDNHAESYPGAPEILDGRDNDCDGIIDDGALLNALNINCGGSIYTDVNGDVFESDRLYKPSNTSTKYFNDIGDILNTDDDALFKSERLNSQNTTSFSYNMKSAPGKFYKVSLYFAEQGTLVNPGERVFNVSIEDSMVLNNFDIIATAGGYKTAYVHDAYIFLRDSTLNIKFTDVVGKAKINAIKAAIQPNIPPTFKLYPVFPAFNEDFTGTKTITLTPDSVYPHEAYQTVTYSLSPATCSFANISINPTTGQISYTSLPNGNGVQVFTVIANDAQAENNIATKTFQLKVLAVNDRPVFTMSGDVNVNKNFLGNIDVTATPAPVPADETAQVVTYSLSPASIPFANVSINSVTGTVSFTSINSMYGTQMFTVTANDGMASNNTFTQTFTFTVNNINYPPTLDAIADLTIDEDAGMQTVNLAGITAGLGEIQAMTMTAISDNVTLIPNPSVNYTNPNITGSLTFSPVADMAGVAHITVTMNDGSLSFDRMFTVTVNSVNDAPVFTMSGDVNVNEDFSSAQHVTITPGVIPADEMSQVVAYSLSPSSVSFANVSINSSTGKVTVTSIANENGSQLFTVIANDGQSQNNTSSQTFTLTVNSVNDAPAFTTSGNVSVSEDFATAQHVLVIPAAVPADEMSQVVSYSLSPASVAFANVSINSATGEVTITSVPNANGSQLFTVTANDSQSMNNMSSQTFMLTINSVNDAPAFTLSGDVTVNEDFASAQHVTVSAGFIPADEMGQIVSYSFSPASVSFATVSINSSTGEVTITSITNAFGSQMFTVTANDGQSQNNISSQTFMLTVNSVNDAPAFTLSGDVTVNEDFATAQHATMSLGFIPSDEMSQVVAYSLSPASVSFANVSINSSSGEVTITSVANSFGSQMITVTADDGQSENNTYSQIFMLTVNSVNDAPAFNLSGDVTVNEDFASTESVTMMPAPIPADEVSQVVNYSLSPSSVSFAVVSINSNTGEVTVTSVADAFGSQIFTITANDGQSQNNIAVATFMLAVNSVNDAPAFTLSGDITVNEDFTSMENVTTIPAPIPADEVGQVVNYSLSPSSVSFANVSINSATGEVTISSITNASGSQMFTVTANDGQSQNNSYSQTFMFTVNSVNDAPVFTLSGDVSLNEDFNTTEVVTIAPGIVPADELSQVVSYSLSPSSVSFANVSINSMTGEVTISSITNAFGSQLFTVSSDDGQSENNTHSATFMLTINSINDAPVFTLSGDVVVDEDFSTTEHVMLASGFVPADEFAQTVVYSLSPAFVSFANVSINSVTGEVSITSIADVSGSQMFTVTADDGQSEGNTYSQTFQLTVNSVNDVPAFTLSGDVSVNEDFSNQLVTVSSVVIPADELTQTVVYSLSPVSVSFANVSINSATGEVSVTSIDNASGSQIFTVTADDLQSENNTYSQSFTLSINSVNDAPEFSLSGDVNVNEDFATAQHVSVLPMAVPVDEMSQTVVYSLSPSSVSFADISFNSSTGEVEILSVSDANGSQLFTITADDGQALNNNYSASFMLNVISENDAPIFALSGDIMVIEGLYTNESVTVSSTFVPADEMSQVVVYSLFPASVDFANVSINSANGEVTITPVQDMFGTQVFTVTADDGQLQNNLYSQTFTLTVDAGNNPPSFTLSGDVIVDEDFSADETVMVTPNPVRPHEAGQVVNYSLSPSSVNFANVSINSNTGEVSITSIADAHGSQHFTITADDGQTRNNLYANTFMLTVNSVNDAPVFTLSGDINVIENFSTTETVTVSTGFVPADEMSQAVVYSLSPASGSLANVSINSLTGVVSITSMQDMFGSQMFTVTADDGQSTNNIYAQTFTLTVNEGNNVPAFTTSGDVTVDEDISTTEVVTITPDALRPVDMGQSVTYSLSPASVSFANVSVNSSTGEVIITSIADANGSQMFTINADDGQSVNSLYSQTFTLTVNSINDAPLFVLSGNVTEDEDFTGARTVSLLPGLVPADETSQVITYSLSPLAVSFANVSINSMTGEVTINSIADVSGSQLFTVAANDGQSLNSTHSATFTLVVNSINDQPTLDPVSDVAVLEDAGINTVNLSGITAGGGENQALVVTVVSDNPSLLSLLSINYSSPSTLGLISFQPAPDKSGSATITVTVNDGQMSENTISRSFVITVNSINDAPEFSLSNSNVMLNEDFTGTNSVSIIQSLVPADEMSQVVTYSLVPSSVSFANVSINSATGEVVITSIADASGSQLFTVTANDGQSQNGIYSATFMFTVNPVNDAPVFTINNSVSVIKNFTTNEIITIVPAPVPADELLQTVTYSLNPASVSFANISFNSLTGTVSITSINDMSGTQTFTVTADDGQVANNLHAEQFVFTVIDTNYQPELNAINSIAIDEDAGVQVVQLSGISAGFNESQVITVTAVSDNPSLISNPVVSYNSPDNIGTLSFAPATDQNGVAVITVTVDDGLSVNNSITRSFTVTVNPVNDVPTLEVISDVSIMEDASMQAIIMSGISAGPNELQTLTVTAVSSNPSLISNPIVVYNNPAVSGVLNYFPVANQYGSALITVTVNDGQANNNISSRTFMVTVNPVDDLPVLSDVYKNGQEDKDLGFQASNFSSRMSDIEGDTLTKINIVSLPANGTLKLNGTVVSAMSEISASDISTLVYDPTNEFAGVDSFAWNGMAGSNYALNNAMVHLNINQVNDKPYVTAHIQDISVNEDASAMLNYVDLDNVFTDIEDAGNMTFTVTMNGNVGMINVTIDTDHMLDISFVENAQGAATVTIQAMDNGGALISDTFSVTVISVEDMPSAFSLLTPADGSLLSNPTAIDFSWETSTDGDGDAVTYSVVIKGHGLDTTMTGVSVASMLFDGSALMTPDSVYNWFVIASDGDDSKMSAMFSFKISLTAVKDPYTLVSTIDAYPNPFNNNVTIKYTLKADSKVTLRILNFLGQEIVTLRNEEQSKGDHKVEWNGNESTSGVYFYELMMDKKDGIEGSFVGKIIKN